MKGNQRKCAEVEATISATTQKHPTFVLVGKAVFTLTFVCNIDSKRVPYIRYDLVFIDMNKWLPFSSAFWSHFFLMVGLFFC